MTISVIATLAFLSGYVTYYFLRFNVSVKHRVLLIFISGIFITLFSIAVVYFVILYKEYPAYLSIMLNFILMIFGFCGGYLVDKSSDKYISSNRWRK